MAKKDNDNFDFEVEGEGKAKAGLNLDFIKNLTKQQKGIILAALVGIVLIVAIIITIVAIGANGGFNNGGTTGGGGNSQTGGSEEKEIIPPDSATEIYIFSQPTQLVYNVGESADYSGMVVGVSTGANTIYYKYDDYKDMFTIKGFDNSEATEAQTITVEYGDNIAEFTIKVISHDTTKASLVGITVDPLPKTTYKVGESFDPTGGYIVCEYSDGTTKDFKLTMKNISGYGAIAYIPGEHQIKIVYSNNNGGYAETYITVTIVE